ncbi:MAG: hypothetical protein EXS60_01950 [Candidatus Pacebacteria bacterium]|nr:hypothetical protein [Candidatus Paceibacterota bacterium]
MRYSLTVIIAIFGVFFLSIGAAGRYALFLSVGRFVHGGQPLDYEILRAENDALKATIAKAAPAGLFLSQHDGAVAFADVFATYPFAGRSVVRVDRGRIDGMRVGYPATFGGSVLAGQVTEVHNRYSVVRMVGSPDWQIPVRIGPHKVAGLLIGGTVARISMIPVGKEIAVGDAIISASIDLPYGLTIGAVSAVSDVTEGGVFKEAEVAFPYDARDIAELAFTVWTHD